MPRIARIVAPGYPHHITQRGNNRATVFFDDEDRQTYLKILGSCSRKKSFSIWAYCLMDNHIHLLAVPETETSLARGIGLTNLLYTQYLNRKLRQSGRIWQNRFFSCVVESNDYLWSVARYIELNPVKAGITHNAQDYRWSSAACHITGAPDPLLGDDSWLLSPDRYRYADFVCIDNDDDDNAIRRATRTGRPYGADDFVYKIETLLGQTLKVRKAGRPRKITADRPLTDCGLEDNG